MFKKDRWKSEVKYPWNKKNMVKILGLFKPIFLDKSIPNIMRVDEIQKVFKPIKFMCMVRNPYVRLKVL